MKFLKNEIPKTLPYAILFGVIGGVLLIVANNVFDPSPWINLAVYMLTGVTATIYVLKNRTKKEIRGSICLTTELFALMTFIAFLDFALNANKNFTNPLFDNALLLPIVLISLLGLDAFLTVSFRRLVR
ncbi:MAG: hypothetical protein MK078_00205 [Crocinitomicaceae bacterium]|nr:hypothetical protein [Crocinitomicaceae bacterium]